MTTHAPPPLISRTRPRPRAGLELVGDLVLARGRVHEFCGPARRTLALIAARGAAQGTAQGSAGGSAGGPVIWIAPAWAPARLNPDGIWPLIEPGRLIFVSPRRGEDLLWCLEEALRAGAAPIVVGDLPEPPGLTPVRRLHLAAEAGGVAAGRAPLGLILTPGEGGAQGVESRWHLAPRQRPTSGPASASGHWQLERRRARADPPAAWGLTGHDSDAGQLAIRLEPPG